MCSELFRIPLEWNGVPIFGYGVLLVAWLVFSAWGMRASARQAGWSAAMWAHLPTVLIVALAIAVFIPMYFTGGVPIRGYGLMVLLGSITGISMAVHRGRQVGVPPDEIIGLTVAMFLCGIVGARLFWVIEYWDEVRQPTVLGTLKTALQYTEGGLVVYGSFIGAMIGFAWFVRRRGLPMLAMSDLVAPCMLAGLALGRIGCLLNGCCYGGESTAPWAVTFPQHNAPLRSNEPERLSPPYANQAATGRFYGMRIVRESEHGAAPKVDRVDAGSLAEQAGLRAGDVIAAINGNRVANVDDAAELLLKTLGEAVEIRTEAGSVFTLPPVEPPARSLRVHPVQIYSSVNAGLLAWLLWTFYPFRRHEGEATALMLILYPIARFFEEWIRIDEPSVFGTGLSISQNISLALVAGAVALGVWLRRRPAGQLDFPLTAAA